MKSILTLVTIFFGLNCTAQTYSPSDFSAHVVPKVNSDSRYQLDTSKKYFSVSIVNGRLQIARYMPTSGWEYPWADGKLLALDMGEWGGGLYYKPDDASKETFFVNGKMVTANNQLENYDVTVLQNDPTRTLIKGKHVLIAPGNTEAIIPYNNCWLFIQGWTNMKGNHGTLSEVTMKKDSFVVSKIFELDAKPTAIAVYKHKFFLVTDNELYLIDKKKKEMVLNNLSYPNSIAVINEKNIYVGMHGGYAKIDLTNREVKFYAFNK